MRGREPKMQSVVFPTLISEVVHHQFYMLVVTHLAPYGKGTAGRCWYREAGTNKFHLGSQIIKETCTKEVVYERCLRMDGVLCEEQRRE